MIDPIQVWRNWRSRLELIASWGLAPTDVVLEVGSGQNPSPRADVLCERYVADGTERHDALPRVDRPLVVGDLARLPFADGAFDFVICTHVLEHVADPGGALAELARVAPRGYVETPSAAWERMHSFPFHRWYVSDEGGTMVFRAKERPIHDAGAKEWLEGLCRGRPGLMDWIFQHERELGVIVGFVWEGRQPARVEGTPAPETAPGFSGAAEASRAEEVEVLRRAEIAGRRAQSLADGLYRLTSRRLRRASTPRVEVERALVCPRCGGALRAEAAPALVTGGSEALDPGGSEALVCAEGHRHDGVRAGERVIPFLLP
ncbi:MAG: class I SAM-dependent methyltransferase [Longimicrobiales bacterium]|nr:class I SAM-dependent methyltransferase [Longimicrobiales bacterium]